VETAELMFLTCQTLS